MQPADAVVWVHALFCSMALPMRATRGAWHRAIDAGFVRIEPSASDDMVPSGRIFRLSMMQICDAAFRSNSVVVELGTDETLLAAAIGIDPKTRDLADQWQRLQAARILLSESGQAEVSVFDARSRRRVGDLAWRCGVRLSTRFLSSLVDHAVPLDRGVVRRLSASPAALDAYAWIAMSIRHAAADQIVTTTWSDLRKRFGTASQDGADFRLAFEVALRLVFEADDSIDLAVGDEGVRVRRTKPAEKANNTERTAPMQPNAEAIDVDAEKQSERLAILPCTGPVCAPPEGAKPAVLRDQAVASQDLPQHDQPVPATSAADRITRDSISLARHLTGLAQVIWLRRGHGEENVLVGVTPSPRFEAERLTVLAVEPMVIQVSGGLNERDFERVSAWVMSNRDVIDEFWEGRITSFSEVNRRVRKAPAPGWR
ncbi:replication protein RepA [Falsiroseomonas sp. HW251]|uniref:replication protein RepA n=1 Tax=Falsiroseomonas sp. HW251 TaxID=3390998 RepID=UPI003D3127E5